MQITLKLEKVIQSISALNELGRKGLPFKLSYRIAKICDKLEPSLKAFNKTKDAKIEAEGKVNEETGRKEVTKATVGAEAAVAFEKEIRDMIENEDVTIDFEQIPLELFMSVKEEVGFEEILLRPILWAIAE